MELHDILFRIGQAWSKSIASLEVVTLPKLFGNETVLPEG